MSGHTPGPWHVCRKGACSCFIVMSDHHPIATITHGIWGDEYPEIRTVQTDDGPSQEAYMEMMEYGEIGGEQARANWHLIAAAPDLLDALKDMLSGWNYIRSVHGDLYGVGWDRAQRPRVAWWRRGWWG